MAYTALYRRLRPQSFKDVIGQDPIVQTLKNQISANRIGHAYLFCGTRGTGKTSTAKIFAKAVNCLRPVDGSPCETCDVCNAINEHHSLNIIEIDAASNNGVDNIRDIREEVRYTPTEGKYKVYIIDEVHMLSTGAFNALLKTLEEPPEHILFILATTEPHKLPITILSRCQRYDFKRIGVSTIADQLMTYMREEQVEVEEKAIQYIAKVADGSMRDALSILDQCLSFLMGQTLTHQKVLEVLGAVDTTVFVQLTDALLLRQMKQCLSLVESLMLQGRDLSQFVQDYTWFLRNMLVAKSVNDASYILDMSEENILILKEQAKKIDEETTIDYIQVFSELVNQLKYASQKRITLEVALIKLCQPSMDHGYDKLSQRIEAIEEKLEAGVVTREVVPHKKEHVAPRPLEQKPKAVTEDMKQLIEKWPSIIEKMPSNIKFYLKKTQVELENTTLTILCEDEFTKLLLETPDKKNMVKQRLEASLNKTIQLQIKEANTQEEEALDREDVIKELQKKVNFDITYEE